MLIRRAEERDIPRIHELLAQVAQVHHTGRPDLFRAGGRKYTDTQLSQKINDENTPIFVAVDDRERVLGYVFCQFEQHVNHNILTNVKTLYIDDLCVDEALRAQHIGGALYAHAAEFARKSGCYNLTLNVWSCNPSAIKFYESCGLRPQKVHLEALLSADGPGAGSAEAAPMIRLARPDDLPALGPVYGVARRFMAEHGNPTQWSDRYPLPEDLEADLQRGELYVFDQDGVIHGAFVLRLGDEPNYRVIEGAWRSGAPYGTIHRVAGDGTVHGLFSACMDFCKRRMSHLRIDTHENNAVMRHLIARHGFLPCGTIYVEDGTPRLAFDWLAE